MKPAVLATLLACAGLLACSEHRHVTLVLGPDSQTPSAGLSCSDGRAGGPPLVARGYDAATHTLSLSIVVDVIDVGDHVPSCLAEEIGATRSDGTCQLQIADAPRRFCEELVIPDVANAAAAPRALVEYVAGRYPEVIADAPDHPVIVRFVATSQACGALTAPAGESWPALDGDAALGCTYSCPVQLDEVTGPISLGLDVPAVGTFPMVCQAAVAACARFPGGGAISREAFDTW